MELWTVSSLRIFRLRVPKAKWKLPIVGPGDVEQVYIAEPEQRAFQYLCIDHGLS